ncbi:MAG: ABC transporter ATP-binding protein [Bacteroidia bacterium]
MSPVLKTQNLSKTYSEGPVAVHALRDISLEIMPGEFTVIIGPSGSGKTTLLNMLGGLDSPSSGKVWVAGTDISDLNENQLIDFRLHHIGFVFQAYNLIPVLTAEENVSFIMDLQGRPDKEIKARAAEVLAEVGLADRAKNRPAELSGGQQQRVAVARALASRPKYVLADEPTANLDSQTAFNLLDTMKRLNVEEQMTFLFSTHDQRVIDRASRVITLVDGSIASDERR